MVLHTKVLGPGTRSAIWFQGCQRRCEGCMSPDTRSPDGGILVSIDRVVEEVSKLNDIEGITISGGEPFLQADALFQLLNSVKKSTNLGVIIYTGFTIEQLHTMNDRKIELILTELADLIIDGEYIDQQNDGRSFIGSSNQRLTFITERYVPFQELYNGKSRNIEVLVSENELFLIGIPDRVTLNNWINTTMQFHIKDR